MGLIVAQHVDAKHAVLSTAAITGSNGNTHQQGRLGRVRRHGTPWRIRHPMTPRNAVGGDHIDGAGGVTHSEQELLPQGPFAGVGFDLPRVPLMRN